MPERSYPGMELLTENDVARIHRVTQELDLHPDWVVVVLDRAPEGKEIMCPDGKILIHAPGRDQFDFWLAGLRARLEALPLGQTPHREEQDPKRFLTGLYGRRFSGTRTYLKDPENFGDLEGGSPAGNSGSK